MKKSPAQRGAFFFFLPALLLSPGLARRRIHRPTAEMPVVPDAALFATGAHDQADDAARDHAVFLGAS
jgi:hypothetical protein